MHRLARLSLTNRALIALITVTIAFFGVTSMTSLKQELIPSISLPQVSVITTYPGASPEIVDNDVTGPIESALQGLQGLEETTTVSSAGSSMVFASFTYGTDIVYAEQRIQQALNRIDGQLPEDSDSSVMSGGVDDLPVIQLAVTGGDAIAVAEHLRVETIGELRSLEGVRAVDLYGDRSERITITPDQEALAANGLTIESITDTLENAGVLVPAGQITEGGETLTVQAGHVVEDVADLAEMPVLGAEVPESGDVVTLDTVADLERNYDPIDSISRVNGEDALTLSITKRPDANTVEVSDAVVAALPELEEELSAAVGEDVQIVVGVDQAPFIVQSIDTLVNEGLLGLLFAVIVIFVFLLSFRATIITAISIPTSLLVTFIGLQFAGYSLNMLTLGALTIAIGRVVDDSIVVVENIRRHLSLHPTASLRGRERVEVISDAVREVASAVTASTISTVAVYVPIMFVADITGELFRPFAFTSALAMIASLLVSLTIVPVLAYWFMGGSKVRGQVPAIGGAGKHAAPVEEHTGGIEVDEPVEVASTRSTGEAAVASTNSTTEPEYVSTAYAHVTVAERDAALEQAESEPRNWLQRIFEPILGWVIRRPWATLAGALVVLIGTGAMVPLLTTNFLGSAGQNTFQLSQELPANASIDVLSDEAAKVESVLDEYDEIELVQLSYGSDPFSAMFGGGSNSAQFSVTVDPDADADALQAELVKFFEERTDLGQVTVGYAGGGFSDEVTVRVSAPDLEVLAEAEALVMPALADTAGVTQAVSDLDETRPYVRLNIDQAEAARLGLSEVAIGGQIAQALQPVQVGQVMMDGQAMNIYFEGGQEPPQSVAELEDLEIQVGPTTVPLSDLADIEVVDGPVAINASSGTPYVEIAVSTDSEDLGGLSAAIQESLDGVELPAGASAELAGTAADQQAAFQQLGLALLAAILIVYIVMVATFKSLLQPFLLLISIPFAATGAILLQVASGIPLGVASLIGVLMLIGIVVTNAIVLIDLVNQYRRRGLTVREATFAGGSRRVRPIIMTALATILALVPMAIGVGGHGGFISQPMAIVVIGGLLSSTLLTLIVLPALYVVVEGALEKRAMKRQERNEQRLREEGLVE
ncbi:efflux RND transporter permease subunit [Gulosibacter molinativorax]|uniref:AcrB/AcrD/AcrF family protein n=1 Tax=Gulosibacter molinativorax TaxID=256821 RepID=A0ABT7C863_9MICO|nr:efflux RND transporter permease subunit [Gulosibacter molinativorax]MDJ1371375.1 AcrB/AcrD/AcrF family protein [Gulosibacter molinativorax]QUY62872.1 Swarming motility protein SwrC [Gulosibacter molinativorax]